jgi:hypothetical protein
VVLGGVEPTRITIEAGSRPRTYHLELSNVALGLEGVGRHVVTWDWQVATAAGTPPTDLATSEHEVFVIIDTPDEPWSGEPVWTEVLEWSCRWATQATSPRVAAASVARRLNAIGGMGVTTWGFADRFRWQGVVKYLVSEAFKCEAFLALLRGETTLAPAYGNCRDLAAAVMVFANALGCRLRRGSISRDDGVPLNEVRVIGLTRNQTSHETGDWFAYHDLAVELAGPTQPAFAYDALLEIDEDAAPEAAPSSWVVASGFPFSGDPGAYLERVVRAEAQGDVSWDTRTAALTIQRPVPSPPPRHIVRRYEEFLRILERPPDGGRADSLPPLPGFQPWKHLLSEPVVSWYVQDVELVENLYLLRPDDRPAVRIWVSEIQCGASDAARRLTAERLAWTSLSLYSPPAAVRYLADRGGHLGGYAVGGRSVFVTVDPETGFDVGPLVVSLALALG